MERSLADLTRRCAREHPDRTAFVSGSSSLTYGQLDDRSDALAARLHAAGAQPGDRMGYLGRNHLGYPIVAVTASKLGAISLGLNWRLSAGELAGVLADAEPHTVFADPEFLPVAEAAIAELHGARPAIVGLADPLALGAGDSAPSPAPVRDAALDEIASLTYTSGTTGRPKGVMTSNGALLEHLGAEMPWTFDETTVALIASPVFHAVGSVWTAMTIRGGATGVLVADPDPAALLAVIEHQRITHAMLVPALLQVLLEHPDRPTRDLSSLRVVVYGASPIAERVLVKAGECLPGCDLVQGYGMTETTGPVTFLLPDDHVPGSTRLRTAGRAAPNCEVRVVDIDARTPVPAGQPGEVQARSAQMCSGYWRNPAETAALFDAGGWLRTGDVGILDADGYLTLTDRVKDVIVTGGENVYSGEVERVLLTLPAISEACVIGVPHEKWGEAVAAFVVATEPTEAADVIAWCRDHLAHYKCPLTVDFVDTLPKNPAGKILRRVVRESASPT